MKERNLEVEYVAEGDLLCLRSDLPGQATGGDIKSKTILTAFHCREGKRACKGFDLYDAARMLMPFLEGEISNGELGEGELTASYTPESDSLVLLSNRHIPVEKQRVAAGLTAHCTDIGWAVGFTLERASEQLLPHLRRWRRPSEKEMWGRQNAS